MRRRGLQLPLWAPVWPQLHDAAVTDGSGSSARGELDPETLPAEQRLALVRSEQQAALLFMLASASAVLLRAVSSFIENVRDSRRIIQIQRYCDAELVLLDLRFSQEVVSFIAVVAVSLIYLVSAAMYWMLHKILAGSTPHWTETWAGAHHQGRA